MLRLLVGLLGRGQNRRNHANRSSFAVGENWSTFRVRAPWMHAQEVCIGTSVPDEETGIAANNECYRQNRWLHLATKIHLWRSRRKRARLSGPARSRGAGSEWIIFFFSPTSDAAFCLL